MNIIYKAAGILIRDRRLLVQRSKGKDIFVAPGGKLEPGETARQAIIRELMEEIQIDVAEQDLTLFGEFEAPAAGHEDKTVKMTVFMVHTWQGELAPDHEIAEIAWVSSANQQQLPLGSIFEHEVIPRLKAADVVD